MFHRFSVDAYHRMLTVGVLPESGRIVLLEGLVVQRATASPPHATSVILVRKAIERLSGPGWEVCEEKPVTLPDSEPHPDVWVARGDESSFDTRHPSPAELALVVEVADSSLGIDRQDMARIYARAGIVEYWIVNLVDQQIEVYTQPSGPGASPGYGRQQVYMAGSAVPLVLDGTTVGTIAVDEVIQ